MNFSKEFGAPQGASRAAARAWMRLDQASAQARSRVLGIARIAALVLPVGLSCAATQSQAIPLPVLDQSESTTGASRGFSPLINKVRRATQRYLDINVALGEGWVRATPCVSGPNEGAMGVHFLKPERLHDGTLKADEPEMLIYEPQRGGTYRLVGVEYLVLASEWASHNPAGSAPSVDGHLANFVGEPNRYALPAFYEMHVWAWEDNPNGNFSDWNSRVSCDKQAAVN